MENKKVSKLTINRQQTTGWLNELFPNPKYIKDNITLPNSNPVGLKSWSSGQTGEAEVIVEEIF